MIALDRGEFIFSVGRDQKIILWNTIDTEAVFEKNTDHNDIITDMCMLNDKLVTSCFDGEVKVFRMLFKRQLVAGYNPDR